MSHPRTRNSFRPGLEALEDRNTPAPLGVPTLPPAGLAGVAVAESHNSSSQAAAHSPVFRGPTGPSAAAVVTLPPGGQAGVANAASHNASSQASAHSPVFQESPPAGPVLPPGGQAGIAIAASHNASSQAPAHSPVFAK
jgi:hypothetical protein